MHLQNQSVTVIESSGGATSTERIEWLTGFLVERGHGAGTIRSYTRCALHFECWFGQRALPGTIPDEEAVREFQESHLADCSCPPPAPIHPDNVRAALRLYLRMLRGRGVLVTSSQPPVTPIDEEVTAFEAYLVETCGVALQTRIYRKRYVREFLQRNFGKRPVEPRLLSPRDVMSFISLRARGCKPGTAKVIASSVRSYLRFVAVRGAGGWELTHAVPTIPAWRLSSIPAHLSADEVRSLLASFDRSTAAGSRDYAVALCLADLGLRTGEVAGLSLDSIDWRNGVVAIAAGKSRRERRLPIPRRVGEAIAAYLEAGRPSSTCRSLFLRHTVPAGTPVTTHIVRGIIRRACARTGLLPPRAGPHALRHTAATRMVNRGATLGEIADLLGHASVESTAIYAKVDLATLNRVAIPWPGVTP